MDLLSKKIDSDNVKKLLKEAGFEEKPDPSDKERWEAYWDTEDDAIEKSVLPIPYDVVLTDMNMPMSRKTLTPSAFQSGEQVPYGFILALRACMMGAKYVAMVTDTNHHKGAMSAALDHLSSAYYDESFKPNFEINGAKVMFIHTPFYREVVGKKECYCDGNGKCHYCEGTGKRDDDPCDICAEEAVGVCTFCNGTGEMDDVIDEKKDWGQVLKDLLQ